MSYADAWNEKWSGPRNNGPTVLIVDGTHEEFVEEIEGMDTDEDFTLESIDALKDVDDQRALWNATGYLNSELMDAMEMDIELNPGSYSQSSRVAVLDTNVLISQLPLLKALVERLMTSARSDLVLLVPGIVVQELDGLRNSKKINTARRTDGTTVQVNVNDVARRANDWLLPLINRNHCIRGQRTTESPRGNWMYDRAGLQNDDLILECANYFTQTNGLRPGDVRIMTGDKNLQLKANTEGYSCIAPMIGWTADQLLSKLQCASTSQEHRSDRPNWAAAPSTKRSVAYEDMPRNAPSAMNELHQPFSTTPSHPLSILQEEIRLFLARSLPDLLEECVAQLRHQRAIEELEDRRLSVYARPKRAAKIPIPDESEWHKWTAKESFLWLDKVLPRSESLPSNSLMKLAEVITPLGERGGRKGEHWGRGDWNEAADTMERLFGSEVAAQLRAAVEQGFTHR